MAMRGWIAAVCGQKPSCKKDLQGLDTCTRLWDMVEEFQMSDAARLGILKGRSLAKSLMGLGGGVKEQGGGDPLCGGEKKIGD